MKMKKRTLIITAVAVVSAALLVTNAFAASNNVSGYEALKQSAFKLVAVENVTADVKASVYEGDTLLMEGQMTQKMESPERSSSFETFFTGDRTQTAETFQKDGTMYMKTGGAEGYQTYQIGRQDSRVEHFTDNQKRLGEFLLDTFVGSAKNYFTNDGENISVKLEGSQIPEIAQLLGAVAVEAANDEMTRNPHGTDVFGMDNVMQIRSDLVIQSAEMNATLDDQGRITTMTGSMVISGDDLDGTAHTYTFRVETNLSDYGITTADLPDVD